MIIKQLAKHFLTVRIANIYRCSGQKNNINQSKYYTPRVNIQQFLTANQINYTSAGTTHRLKECPFCTKPHNNQPTNMHTLNIHKQNGVFYCHRCTARGSWLDLKKKMLGVKDQWFENANDYINSSASNGTSKMNKVTDVQYFIYYQSLKRQDFKDVRQYIHQRNLKSQTIEAYKLGGGYQAFYNENGQSVSVKVIYFPMFRMLSSKELQKRADSELKYLADSLSKKSLQPELLQSTTVPENKQKIKHFLGSDLVQIMKYKIRGSGPANKRYMRQSPAGPQSGFFGLNLVKKQDKVVVITEGEFDAMAVYQETGIPAISLPQGASNLPDAILPYLDQFEKIILWMDNDQAGRMGEDKIAHKLGLSRTFIVRNLSSTLKDANDFLLNDKTQIAHLIADARTIPDQNVLTFSSLRQSIKNKIYKFQQHMGLQIDFFTFFNKKVKGLRTSELSIVSGPTGCGKTTFLSQITTQLCGKGIPVLWGSFQVKNQVLATNMLIQYSKINLTHHKDKFEYYADQFANLPLYYLSFHGSSDVDKVIGTIEYAIEKYNVSLVVIDTLQFLLSNQAEGFKKFDLQDKVMSRLRKLTTDYNIHLVIVIHPRKTQDSQDIGIHSIYGTSKAPQQADNIWIIQNRQGFKIFDIKKNRFDGQIGRAAIAYDRDVKSFFQLKRNQLESIFKKQKTIDEIIDQRKLNKQDDFSPVTKEDSYGVEEGMLNKQFQKKKYN